MLAKELLVNIKILEYKVKNKQREVDFLKSKIQYRSPSFEERVQQSAVGDAQTNLLVKWIDYENELNEDIDKLIDAKKNVMKIIDQLDDGDCIDVLYKRYIHLMRFDEIAVKKNVTSRCIYKIHHKALIKIQKILDCSL